jgi:hypothetical protein
MSWRDQTPWRIVIVGLGAACVLGGVVGGIEASSGQRAPSQQAGAIVHFHQATGDSGSATTTTAAGVTSTTGATTTTSAPAVAPAATNAAASETTGNRGHGAKTAGRSTTAASTPPPAATNPPAPPTTTPTTVPASYAQGLPTWLELSATCSAASGVMSEETETVSGNVANFSGGVTIVVPGASVVAGSGVINETDAVAAPSGLFTATFTQQDSNIDLCSGSGTIDAMTSSGLPETAPNPSWGQRTCSYSPPATGCRP